MESKVVSRWCCDPTEMIKCHLVQRLHSSAFTANWNREGFPRRRQILSLSTLGSCFQMKTIKWKLEKINIKLFDETNNSWVDSTTVSSHTNNCSLNHCPCQCLKMYYMYSSGEYISALTLKWKFKEQSSMFHGDFTHWQRASCLIKP